jgi:Fe-S-cluster containining protein
MEEITEESFKKAVEEKRNTRSLPFILAVYQTLDEFLKQEVEKTGVSLACKKGCSFCCYQLICCTEMEFDEILRYIKNLRRPIRRPLELRLQRFAKKWLKYYQKNEATLQKNSFRQYQDWWGKPCPFLNQETASCDIYSVRIIDCRTTSSLIPCLPTKAPNREKSEPNRFRFQSEIWANNLILEEQKKTGVFGVTPISHWPCLKGFLRR